MAGPNYDAPPIRPGAEVTLDAAAVRFTEESTWQPVWIRMTPVLVRWLRHHFSVASRIEFPNLTERVWTNDPATTGIVITSLAEWNPRQSGQRPTILVDRLDQQEDLSKRPIGMQFQGIRKDYFMSFMQGQHVIHCLGGREGEAEFLADEVWREMKRFSPRIQPYLCLYRFQPLSITKRRQLSDEYKEHFVTSVPIMYYYDESWRLYNVGESEVTNIGTVLAGL